MNGKAAVPAGNVAGKGHGKAKATHVKSKASFLGKLAGRHAPAPKHNEGAEAPQEEAGESKAQEDAEQTVEDESDDYINGPSHAELFQKRMSQKRSGK